MSVVEKNHESLSSRMFFKNNNTDNVQKTSPKVLKKEKKINHQQGLAYSTAQEISKRMFL
jgi:hypothetical protein